MIHPAPSHFPHRHDRHSSSPIEVFPKTPEPMSLPHSSSVPFSLPHSHPYHHNLHLGENSYLKIDKRNFSDESKVSSVSSFSSVGDAFASSHSPAANTTSTRSFAPPARGFSKHLAPASRQSSLGSSTSAASEATQSSWNSIQKSIDINTADNASEWTLASSSQSESGGPSRQSSVSTENDTQETIKPLQIHKKEASVADSTAAPIRRVVTSKDVDDSLNDDDMIDNGGAGIGFSFPNNASNITNSEEARRRALQARKQNSVRSRRDVVSVDGQIEIPNLDDDNGDATSLYHTKEARHNGVSFNDLLRIDDTQNEVESQPEPIGVPGLAAKDHFKSMYGSNSADSDSDSSFNSQFSRLNASSKTASESAHSFPTSKSLNTLASSRKSPVRHSRHRSMYSIDLSSLNDSLGGEKSHLGHTKSKSIGSDLRATQVNLARPASRSRSPPVVNQKLSNEPEEPLKIIVEEPPKKVEYAVDFKDATPLVAKANSSYEDPFASGYYNRSLSRLGSRRGQSPSVLSKRDSRSSHSEMSNSMATARDSASTAPTETSSVTIDLTKEDYNVCMIKRHDSTLSYKSIIEKRNGKPVEVVLVDEDEENRREKMRESQAEDRDDLLSIYSRYMQGWEPKNSRRYDEYRYPSRRSLVSDMSDTNESWRNSESGFQVKPRLSARSAIMRARSGQSQRNTTEPLKNLNSVSSLRNNPPSHRRVRSTPLKNVDLNNQPLKNSLLPEATDTNYFDYISNEKYDFNTFMRQRAAQL